MFKNTMKTTVLLAALGGLIVAVAGLIGGGSSTALTIGLVPRVRDGGRLVLVQRQARPRVRPGPR